MTANVAPYPHPTPREIHANDNCRLWRQRLLKKGRCWWSPRGSHLEEIEVRLDRRDSLWHLTRPPQQPLTTAGVDPYPRSTPREILPLWITRDVDEVDEVLEGPTWKRLRLGWIGEARCDTWLAHHNSHWRLQVLIPTLPQRRDVSSQGEEVRSAWRIKWEVFACAYLFVHILHA